MSNLTNLVSNGTWPAGFIINIKDALYLSSERIQFIKKNMYRIFLPHIYLYELNKPCQVFKFIKINYQYFKYTEQDLLSIIDNEYIDFSSYNIIIIQTPDLYHNRYICVHNYIPMSIIDHFAFYPIIFSSKYLFFSHKIKVKANQVYMNKLQNIMDSFDILDDLRR